MRKATSTFNCFVFHAQQPHNNVFLFFLTGYDLIEWLMDRLSIEDSRKFKNKLKHFWQPLWSLKILAYEFHTYVHLS